MQTGLTSNAGAPALDAAPRAVVAEFSAAEERFERMRRTAGLLLGPLGFCVVLLAPVAGLSSDANRLLAVTTLVVVWWISEAIPIPVTALIGSALAVLCGIAPASQVFAPYASPTIFLFIGSFMLAQAIAVHGLDRRLALMLVRLPSVAGELTRVRAALGVMTLLISGWMSNTATTAMMVPIALGVLGGATAGTRGSAGVKAGFLLTIAYAASIGGMMTPVGSPPNLITLGLLSEIAQVEISFVQWILLVAPIALAYGAITIFLMPNLMNAGEGGPVAEGVATVEADGSRWTRGQINCAIAFGVAVTLWVVPGLLALGAEPGSRLASLAGRFDEGVVAVSAAALLFLLPVNWERRTFTLDWPAASRIDWGTILLFGGGLSLGQLMFSTGLAAHIGEGVVRFSGAESLWTITAVATAVALVLSEVTSNTAATSMLVPVVLSIAAAAGVSPLPPAIGACLGASLAFMFPISTPPNALVYGTGLVPITLMMRQGVIMDVLGFVVIMIGLRVLCPLLGMI